MSIELKVYDNGDHTCLVWLPDDGKTLANCRGFTIRRIKGGKQDYLHGFVGFSDADKFDPAKPWRFPIQRFMWWDYGVKPGDIVQYSVVPVVGSRSDGLKPDPANASPLTPEMTITGQNTPHISSFFNKGIVAAQWVSRALDSAPKGSKIRDLVATPGNPLRNALSGLLRPEILSLLADAQKNRGKIYAALYELNDKELIPALQAFGKDCNLILANGAFKPPTNDENAAVRATLKNKINLFDRLVTGTHFAHNKFVVFCDADGKPRQVLTGSTNWTSSGLCTQANNSLIIDDANVAQDFLDAWNRIKAAGNEYPKAFIDGNSTARTIQVDECKVTPWFASTSAAQDLEYARNLINHAKDGILFLFFNPGPFRVEPMQWTLLQNILERHNESNANYNPDLYIRGVVNQDIPQLTKPGVPKTGQQQPAAALDPTTAVESPVSLFKGGAEAPLRLSHDDMVPHNIKSRFHDWEQELLGASMVNIHSKVIVLDPFGDNPVVMTGSHNLGYKASHENDDNLVIVQGNAPLAAAYAMNIIAIYQTYRWNSYVEAHRKDPKVWNGLVDNDEWQTSYLVGDELAELKFWLDQKSAGPAAPIAGSGASPGPGTALRVRSVTTRKTVPAKKTSTKAAKKTGKKAVKKKAVKKKAKKK